MADRIAQLAGYRNELAIAQARGHEDRAAAIRAEIARIERDLGVAVETTEARRPPERTAPRRKAGG